MTDFEADPDYEVNRPGFAEGSNSNLLCPCAFDLRILQDLHLQRKVRSGGPHRDDG